MSPENQAIDLLALCRVKGVRWDFIARQAQRPGGVARLFAGESDEDSSDAAETFRLLRLAEADLPKHRRDVARYLAEAESDGIRLTTVLDEDYPVNLRAIYNLPPFLFYRGSLFLDDARSVAVVGTRQATDDGLRRARKLAHNLAKANVTVLSGLARGIDTAAHSASLEAGGRTIAVLGTGIRRIYPPENEPLLEQITSSEGAVVSQFWPDTPPSRFTFPRRNVVTSGMGQGTVVIEASATSGAKMQARLALEHGKKVFLLASLVEEHLWARRYVDRGAIVVDDVDDILSRLREPVAIREQTHLRLRIALALA